MSRPAFILLLALWASALPAVADSIDPVIEGDMPSDGLGSFWQEQRASGAWRNNYYHSSRNLDDEAGFIGTTVELKLLPQFSDTIGGKIEWRGSDPSTGGDSDQSIETESRLLEAYALVNFASA